jgi:hypothetical protein
MLGIKIIVLWYIDVFIFDRGVKINKTFTLRLIIQILLQLYNRYIFFNLTKTKALLMASTSKNVFNIDSLTIHSTLNIPVQWSLFSLPNLSLYSLNRLTYRYVQLQLVMIDKISLVDVKMFNVIDNKLRSIKHIQNKFFGDVDVILTSYLYQTPHMKDNWIFQNIKC